MRLFAVSLAALLFAGCASIKPSPKTVEEEEPVSVQYGTASYYAGRWIGRKTANGEIYRAGDRTAAHRRLPFNTRVRVTDLKTGKSTIVRINNRGPYVRGRIIDLSLVAAREIGLTRKRGIARVKLEVLPPKAEEPQEKPRSAFARFFAPRKRSTGVVRTDQGSARGN